MHVRKPVLPAISLALILAGCGGSGGGSDSGLPAPPEGKATVDGKVLVNADPQAGANVTLVRMKGDKSAGEMKAKTDAAGHFVFESVEPGMYQLSVGVFIEGKRPQTSMSPLEFGGPCSESDFEVLVAYMENKKTGKEGFVAQPFSAKSFEVKAGERITKDTVFKCQV